MFLLKDSVVPSSFSLLSIKDCTVVSMLCAGSTSLLWFDGSVIWSAFSWLSLEDDTVVSMLCIVATSLLWLDESVASSALSWLSLKDGTVVSMLSIVSTWVDGSVVSSAFFWLSLNGSVDSMLSSVSTSVFWIDGSVVSGFFTLLSLKDDPDFVVSVSLAGKLVPSLFELSSLSTVVVLETSLGSVATDSFSGGSFVSFSSLFVSVLWLAVSVVLLDSSSESFSDSLVLKKELSRILSISLILSSDSSAFSWLLLKDGAVVSML